MDGSAPLLRVDQNDKAVGRKRVYRYSEMDGARYHCCRCDRVLPREDFSRSSSAYSGLQTYCKKCHADMQRANPAAGRLRRKRYESRHRARAIYRHLYRRAAGAPCMSIDDFEAWYSAEPKECVYCGLSDEQSISIFAHRLHIDRKEGTLGYTSGNICLACPKCNAVKNGYLTFGQMKIVAGMFFCDPPINAHDDLLPFAHEAPDVVLDGALAALDKATGGGE